MAQDTIRFFHMYEDSREMLNLIAQTKPVVTQKENDKPVRKNSATRAQYRRASDASTEGFQVREDDSRFACNQVISNAQTSADGWGSPQRRRSHSDACGIKRKETPQPQELSMYSRRLIQQMKANPVDSDDTNLAKSSLRRGSAPVVETGALTTVTEEDEGAENIVEDNVENVPTGRKLSIRQKLSVFFKGEKTSSHRA